MRLMRTTWRSLACRATPIVAACLFLALLIPPTVASAESKPSTHRYIPSKDLVAYFEFDGLDAHADAWKATAAHAMLAGTRVRTMTTEVARQSADWFLKEKLGALTGDDAIAVYEHLMSKGFIAAMYYHGNDHFTVIVVLNGLKSTMLLDRFRDVRPLLFGPDEKGGGLLLGPASLRGRDIYSMGGDEPRRQKKGARVPNPDLGVDEESKWNDSFFAAWLEGDDLIMIASDDMTDARLNSIFDAIDAKMPNVTTDPGYRAAVAEENDVKRFESAGLFFVAPTNGAGLMTGLSLLGDAEFFERARRESVWAVVESDGLDEIKGISGRWGFQGKAFITDVRIEAPVPRKVLSVCLDQPPLNKKNLPPIPRAIQSFSVGSFDPARNYQTLSGLLSSLGARGTDEVCRIEKFVRDETNLQLRDDLLKHVGPTWWTYSAPSKAEGGREPDMADPSSYVFLTNVDDAETFIKVLETLALRVGESVPDLAREDAANPSHKKDITNRKPALERLPAPVRGFRLTAVGCRMLGLDTIVQPVILVGDSFIAMATDVDRAREALASTSGVGRFRTPSGELAKALDDLPAGLTFLAVADQSDSCLPERIVSLPSIVQFVCNMSLENDPQNASGQFLFDLVGIPRPGGLGIKIGPSQRPSPDDLRAYLFPSVLAGTANERGYRLISREAVPLNLLADVTSVKWTFGAGWTVDEGFRFAEGLSIRILGLDPSQW